jgi:hypothetical protein
VQPFLLADGSANEAIVLSAAACLAAAPARRPKTFYEDSGDLVSALYGFGGDPDAAFSNEGALEPLFFELEIEPGRGGGAPCIIDCEVRRGASTSAEQADEPAPTSICGFARCDFLAEAYSAPRPPSCPRRPIGATRPPRPRT